MERLVFSRVVIRRSANELSVDRRIGGPVAVVVPALLWLAILAIVFSTVPGRGAFYFAIAMTVGALAAINTAWMPTRLRLNPGGFSLLTRTLFRRNEVTGSISDLDVVGIILMNPLLDDRPQPSPVFFLQIAVRGTTIRAFRGVPQSELEEIVAQIRVWKTSRGV